ncbi:MAG: hypothetical protein QM780_16200 [Hyphomicrobium sp.]|uniref:hypothetical protein n=1 Tax=Hyphomicrobium sp. TaxID=82 RepID=UPI0039E4DBD1
MIGHLATLACALPLQLGISAWSYRTKRLEPGEAAFWGVAVFIGLELIHLGAFA